MDTASGPLNIPVCSTQERGFHSTFLQSVLLTPPTYIWGVVIPKVDETSNTTLGKTATSLQLVIIICRIFVGDGHYGVLDNTLYVTTCCVMFLARFSRYVSTTLP